MRRAKVTNFKVGKARPLPTWAAALAASALWCASAHADFSLQGKTVRLYAGSGPGGGIINFGQTLLPYFTRHLPGNPTIVVLNLAGAGGVQAAQQLYNLAARDGTAFGLFGPAPLGQPFLGLDDPGYDVAKFQWIGSLLSGVTACYVKSGSAIASWKDALTRQVSISAAGSSSGTASFARLMNALLGTKFKVIAGYNGTGETFLAVQRGEVDGSCNSIDTLRGSNELSDDLRFIIQGTVGSKDPHYPDLPNLTDLVKNDADLQAVKLLLTPYQIEDVFALPPGVPGEAVAAWRAAFDATIKDPDYIAAAAKLRQDVSPRAGAEIAPYVAQMAATPADVRRRVIQLTSGQ